MFTSHFRACTIPCVFNFHASGRVLGEAFLSLLIIMGLRLDLEWVSILLYFLLNLVSCRHIPD